MSRCATVIVIGLVIGVPCSAQTAARAVPVVDTNELMDLFLEPFYLELKQSLEKPPQNRKEWAAIYRAAVRLAEADNLLFIRTSSRHTCWAPVSAAARQAADIATATFAALRSARPDDFEPLKARLTNVAETCNACHRTLQVDAKTIRP
jgi:hypothetical protein